MSLLPTDGQTPPSTELLDLTIQSCRYGPAEISLHYDVLDMIVAYVFYDHPQDLLALSRASKQLYFTCIPWIYRITTINFSDLGVVVLRRLSRGQSTISTYVRSMVLKHCAKATSDDWVLVYKCLIRFARLESFFWDDYANIPRFVLENVHFHHPRSAVRAKVSRIYASQSTDG